MYNDDSLILLLSLARITFLSYNEKEILLKNVSSSESLSLLTKDDISLIIKRKLTSKSIWNGKSNLEAAKKTLEYCNLFKIGILSYYSPLYPELLKNITDPPLILFYKGDISILQNNNISVVGTRRITPGGKEAALDFAYNACLNGNNIVSGLANGVDAYAHKGAINAYFDTIYKKKDVKKIGKTIAVLPSSIDNIIPVSNKKLASQILQTGGCIISEYEPNLQMATWHYVGRNRIIAALSSSTVVVEAPCGSGALITADFALEDGRDVFFHQIAFSDMAQNVNNVVKSNLEQQFAKGEVSKYKMENTPEKYLEYGAPVIKDFDDYCLALNELPGNHRNNIMQGELF